VRRFSLVLVGAAMCLLPAVSTPSTILSENFDELTPAIAVTSAGVFTALNGTNVDIVGNLNGNYFSNLAVLPESGNALDLDGTLGNSQGVISTGAITLNPGVAYTLSFDLIGSQRGTTTSTTVSFGSYSQTFILQGDDANGMVTVPVTVSSTTVTHLVFASNTPGDIGALLDNVLILAAADPISGDPASADPPPVPEPRAFTLSAIGLGALLLMRRRLNVSPAKQL